MTKDSPRILYVTSCWPGDKSYGGQLRAFHVGRALQKIGRPTLVVVGADEVQPEAKVRTAQEYDVAREIKVVRSAPRSFVSRGVSIFDPAFTNIHGLVAEAQDEAWLKEFQKQFDLTWFCKLRTANYLAKANWPRSVMDVDDLPSTMELSYLKTSPDMRTRLKSSFRIFELARHETRLGRRFDVLGVCSENDRSLLDARSPIHVIPNGFERPVTLPVRQLSQPPRIGFMGLYSYGPNLEGVGWFIRNCWDRVKLEVPGVRLRLVGEDSDGPLAPNDPAVDGLGWVEKPEDEVASWSHMIVPIRFGAGTRMKIADAFSRKCPVVSTRFGALGYEVDNDREIFLADEPADFAAACIRLLKNPEMAKSMAERAHSKFLENWTWEAISPKVLDAAEDCLRINFGR